jgi:hypothetical protein
MIKRKQLIIRRRKSQRGMVMVGAMLVLFILLTIVLIGVAGSMNGPSSSGAVTTMNNGMQLVAARGQSVSSFNMAESGVEYTLQWLHEQSSPPNNTSPFAPTLWSGSPSGERQVVTVYDSIGDAVGSFSVRIYPISTNAGNSQKMYVIESVGVCGGFSQIVQAYVQQASFSKYSYFSNTEISNGYWVSGMNTFDGPLHSNSVDIYNLNNPNPIPTNILWYDTGNATPMFTWNGPDAFSSVASSVAWQRDSIGNFSAPQTNSEWLSVATGGASSISTGADKVPMPTTNNLQQIAAIGSASVPVATGVVVPTTNGSTSAGIYIHGAVQNMTLTTPAPTTQEIEIDQTQSNGKPLITYITKNLATSQTSVQVNTTQTDGSVTSNATTYSGVTNGVIYADSQIGSNGPPGEGLSGVVANNYTDGSGNIITSSQITIATPTNHSIYMNGSLTMLTQRLQANGNPVPESQDPNYVQKAGTLGLVSGNVIIDDTTSANHMLTNEQIDGVVMASNGSNGGSIQPNNYGYNGAQRGTFTINGGSIDYDEGIFGEIDWNGNLIEGFAEHYHYDPRLADRPPPFFPTSGEEYDVLSWQRVGSTLE